MTNMYFFFKKLCFVLEYSRLWRRQWHPTPVLLPGKSHGWRSLVGCSPWGLKESDMTERLHFDFSLSCIREGNVNPLQCSCLENPRDRGAWWAAIYGVAQSRTRLKRLSSSSMADEQCCDRFRWTAKGRSHAYTCIHPPQDPPPIQAATWHWAESPVLYSRSLLVLHCKYSSVYISIPKALTIPSLHPCPHYLATIN